MPARPALKEYRRKRDFRRSPEPRGADARVREHGRSYCIQKHAARRLHYDFRLELGGTLKSWAVPKGPSANPKDRRLAVHVEDHPVEYGGFEGIIRPPAYGAGTVMLWDRGEWEPLEDPGRGYRSGRLKFRLKGERLQGTWSLVRMTGPAGEDGKNWLLIKDGEEPAPSDPVERFDTSVATGRTMEQIKAGAPADPRSAAPAAPAAAQSVPEDDGPLAEAPRAALPRRFSPQLATLVDRAPAGEGWIHEVKFDGYRLLCFLEEGKVRLVTRNGLDWTGRFPAVARAAAALRARRALIDGEVVALKPDGTSDFQLLQNHLNGGGKTPLVYMAFDLVHLDGCDLSRLPLVRRKDALRRLLERAPSPTVRYSAHLEGRGEEVHRNACGHALEGIISKRADAPYVQRRTRDWVKVKCMKEQEFVIGGFTAPKGARVHFGSLLIGARDAKGRLAYHGHVGTGFTEESLKELSRKLAPLVREESPFAAPVEDKLRRSVTWVEPELVCQVGFIGWTEEGYCRHPTFMGLREDKPPRDVGVEESVPAPGAPPRGASPGDGVVAGVRLSHPDRVLYADQGLTKRDLALYFEAVAPLMLPHLKGRPVALLRCPSGREKACFYQKHPSDASADLRRISIAEKEGPGDYLIIDDAKGLVTLAQMGVLEVHPWGSTEAALERPDRLVFDLDPAPGVPWARTVLAARRVRERLEALDLESFVKTTGGKGLHVVAPIVPELEWDAVKAFTKAMAEAMAEAHPGEYVVKMSKTLRRGRIFVDYLRNGRGATAVCPFSPRAKPGATASAPLRWEELSEKTDPSSFTVRSMPRRLAGLKKDPWTGFFFLRQRLPADVRRSLGG